jgi:hypothetical protein
MIYQYGYGTPFGKPLTVELIAETLIKWAEDELEDETESTAVCARVEALVRAVVDGGGLALNDWNKEVQLGQYMSGTADGADDAADDSGGENAMTFCIFERTDQAHLRSHGYCTPIGLLTCKLDRCDHAYRLFGLHPCVPKLAELLHWLSRGRRGVPETLVLERTALDGAAVWSPFAYPDAGPPPPPSAATPVTFRVCQARTKTSKPWRLARLNHEYSPWSGSWMPPTTYYFDNGSRMGFSEFWWTSGHDGSCLDVFQDQAATHETLFRVVLETRGSDAPHPWTFRAMLESGPAMPLRKCLELPESGPETHAALVEQVLAKVARDPKKWTPAEMYYRPMVGGYCGAGADYETHSCECASESADDEDSESADDEDSTTRLRELEAENDEDSTTRLRELEAENASLRRKLGRLGHYEGDAVIDMTINSDSESDTEPSSKRPKVSSLRKLQDQEATARIVKIKDERKEAQEEAEDQTELAGQLYLSENSKMGQIDELKSQLSSKDRELEARDARISSLETRVAELEGLLAASTAPAPEQNSARPRRRR